MRGKRLFGVTVVLCILLAGLSTGASLAWLKSETKSVSNRFTTGIVQIQLTETWNADKNADGEEDAWEGIVVPGTALVKDPVVTVPEDCLDSWIFVQLKETGWPIETSGESGIHYGLAEGWKPLPGNTEIYYREVDADASERSFPVLAQNSLFVSETLTEQEMAIKEDTKLTVSACAIQRAGFDTPVEAWALIASGA